MIALIPSIGSSPHLAKLLQTIYFEVDEIILCDNSVDDAEDSKPLAMAREVGVDVTFVANAGETIYEGWNRGIRRSTELRVPVAILNDDIVLPPESLRAARMALTPKFGLMGLNYLNPHGKVDRFGEVRRVHGTFRTNGFGGFAFVLPPGSPEVDSRFRWWYGDDDLAQRVMATGKKLGVAMGAPVDHPTPSLTGNQQPWLAEAIAADTKLYYELWPNG